MINIKMFSFNPFCENTFIVSNKNDGIIIDPGCLYDDEFVELDTYLEQNKIDVKAILITHGHLDHVFGCKYIANKYNTKIYLPELDKPLYDNLEQQSIQFNIELDMPPAPDYLIKNEDTLTLCDFKIKPLFTPGHSAGEMCYFFEQDNVCFTGDVLFSGSIGRTDLWEGNYNTIISSIKNKLFTLKDDVVIYPGHGEESTIGNERQNNPFFT